jgi:regulator of replication initiation timing
MITIEAMEEFVMTIFGNKTYVRHDPDDQTKIGIRRDPIIPREPVNEYAPMAKRPLSRAVEQHFSELERLEEQNETLRNIIDKMHADNRKMLAENAALKLEVETVKRMASDEHKRAFHYEQYASTLAAHVGVIRTSLDAMSLEAVNMKPYESAPDAKAMADQDQMEYAMLGDPAGVKVKICGLHQFDNGRWGCEQCDTSWDDKPTCAEYAHVQRDAAV